MDEWKALAELLGLLVTDPRTGVLLALLAVAAFIDWRTLRIPNWLTVAGMVAGVMLQATYARSASGGAATALMGLAVGLVLLWPLWLLRLLGAGDVKLMAAVGAFLGPIAVLKALVFVLVTGGALALLFVMSHGAMTHLLVNLRVLGGVLLPSGGGTGAARPLAERITVGRLPYAACIGLGTTLFLLARQLGYVH